MRPEIDIVTNLNISAVTFGGYRDYYDATTRISRPSKLLRARLLKGRDRFVSRSPSLGAMSAGLEVTTLLWRDRTVSAARSHVQG